MYESVKEQSKNAVLELLDICNLNPGDIFIVGCSSSEIMGGKIGKFSNFDVAKAVFEGISSVLEERGVFLAAQCCEHLNRALVIEKECANKYGYEIVSVIPQPKAGGSFATAAYQGFKEPVLVEHIKAAAGMDIGDTFIGMHLKDVAVPVRLSISSIGEAHLTCARTRPKYIGGSRAVYSL